MMSAEPNNVEVNIAKHLAAIDLCLSNHLRMPALVLIYSGIDILASLARPPANPDTSRSDFINWCNSYLVPSGFNECSPIELYSARCAVIHTYSSESSLSRKGVARAVIYAWGDHPPKPLQDVIDFVGLKAIVVIHIDGLAHALREAGSFFFTKINEDPELRQLVTARGLTFFQDHCDVLDP